MIAKLKPKSDFAKNVITLMTGTTVAQAIPIAISPILTRIYTPKDFGILALFVSITAIFSTIATARYEMAIMLPKKDEDAINIVALSTLISVAISLIMLIIIVAFNSYFVELLGNKEIGVWLYFIPITVLFFGLFNTLTYYNTRKKFYKDISKATVLKSFTLASIQLIIGFLKGGATGLISGQIFSQFVANGKLLKNVVANKELLKNINISKIKTLAKEYISFPKYSMPSAIIHSLGFDFVNILISSLFSIATLGFYSFVQKLLGMPTALIGTSISQVFFQEATEEKHKSGNSLRTFKATVKKLLLIAIPSFGILFFSVEDLFKFIFGQEWAIAGVYAKIVIPMFFFNFVFVSVSTIYDIYDALKIELIWKIAMFAGTFIILYLFKDSGFISFLTALTIFSSIMYIITFIIAYNLSKGKE